MDLFFMIDSNQERMATTDPVVKATAAGTIPAISPITDDTPERPRTMFQLSTTSRAAERYEGQHEYQQDTTQSSNEAKEKLLQTRTGTG